MKLTQELIQKHKDRIKSVLDEARVKAHTRRSKTGKSYQVKDFERKDKSGMGGSKLKKGALKKDPELAKRVLMKRDKVFKRVVAMDRETPSISDDNKKSMHLRRLGGLMKAEDRLALTVRRLLGKRGEAKRVRGRIKV